MEHRYDTLTEEALRQRPSVKWQWFPPDVIPCWVADMDFPPAQEIRDAITRFAQDGDLGYPPMAGLAGLSETVAGRLQERHGLEVTPEQVHLMPGIIPGLYLSCLTLAGPGEGVVVQPPIYPPFMSAVADTGREMVLNPMVETGEGWRFDLAGLEAAITPSTRLLMLCNPQNPTGRSFSREELEGLAEVVLRHRLWVVSDELHADLTLDGRHVPFASLSPEVAQRTLTLYGPTKAFNIAGLKIGFAISANAHLLERVKKAGAGLVVPGNVLAQRATMAAFEQAGGWLDDTLDYLRANRQAVLDFVEGNLPRVRVVAPEATYLAWLDFREAGIEGQASEFLLERARVGLNPGSAFGPGDSNDYDGFARLNFATSREIVLKALGQIAEALPVQVG